MIFVNLVYNSTIMRWYTLHIEFNKSIPKTDIKILLGDNYSSSTKDNALDSLIKTFRYSPIGKELGVGICEIKGNSVVSITQTLLSRLEGVKSKGKILVVHKASAAGVVSDNLLFASIQESVKQALRENGYTYFGGKALYDNVIDILKDVNGAFNFRGAFNTYRNKFLEYENAQSVVDDLMELGPEGGMELLERIIDVADKCGFNFTKKAEDIVMWLEDIIKGNNIYSIVFIWDEFTQFFQNNQDSTAGLQELAQASISIPFYFLLITHKAHSSFIYDVDTRKKLEARFKMQKLEMANTTAFMLMRQAIEVVHDLRAEWQEKIANNLWNKVERSVRNTINKYLEDINNNDLKGLLPLHPFAAFMLQIISATINSNQRSMFQFLCGDPNASEAEKHNFRWYIKNNSVNVNQYHIMANYDRFSIGGNITGEIHGGATLEEVLVPIVSISKVRIDNKVSIKLITKEIKQQAGKKVTVRFKLSEQFDEVFAIVDNIKYKCFFDDEWYFELNVGKKEEYNVKLVSKGIIGEFGFKVIKGRTDNKDFNI